MKLLGIDYGTKRIGIAVGDTDPFFVHPLRTIASDREDAAQEIGRIAVEEDAKRIVVGMPYRMTGEGRPGETEGEAGRFAAALRKETGIPVEVEDERLTTAVADRLRKEAGTPKGRFDRDAAAAAVLLESYIERMNLKG